MRALRVVVVAAIFATGAVADADAGTYTVYACRTSFGAVPASAWVASPLPEGAPAPGDLVGEHRCAFLAPLDFEMDALLGGDMRGIRWSFIAPEGTSVETVSLWRHAKLADDMFGRYRVMAGDRTLEESPAQGPWQFGNNWASTVEATDMRAPRVDVEFTCLEGRGFCAGAAFVRITRADVTVRDEIAPALAAIPSGRLVSGQPLHGVADLKLAFRDQGAGVDTIELKVDGSTQSVTRVGGPSCAEPFAAAVPCAANGELTMFLDTDALADGPHTVEAGLTDAAGNRTVVGPFNVTVRAPLTAAGTVSPSSGADAPSSPHLAPSTTVSVVGSRVRRVRYAPATIKGVLNAVGGGAVAGGRIEVATRPLRGGSWSPKSVATADRNGRFSFALPAGPSREVRVSSGGSSTTIRLVVRAPIRLKRDPTRVRNGRTVTFSGSVPGAESASTRVELQARAGRRWVPFKTTPLRNGRFNASYRFTSTYQRTRYRFRAVVHESGDFPYASGKSPTVSVVVAP